MDTATQSLNHITKSGEYTVVPNVVVFDEHEEFDHEGTSVRKFDREKLQKIVDECNRRGKNGDLSPFGPGHTISGAPEHLQPPTYGYAKDFRVGTFGPEKKLGILCSWYVKKQVKTPDGKTADGVEEVKSYPRRSIELWLKDGFIDHIALLRRTPQRDLGLLDFARGGEYVTIPTTDNLFSAPSRQHSLAAAVRGGKLCYAMEYAMPMDNVPAMSAGSPSGTNTFAPGMGDDDQDYSQFCKNADRYMKEHFGDNLAKYQVQPGMADLPGDPTVPPKAGPDDVSKMAKMFATGDEKIKVAMFSRLLNEVASIKAGSKDQADRYSKEDASNRVALLAGQGIILDPVTEQKEFEDLPLGEARDKYQTKIATHYQRDLNFAGAPPMRGNMLDLHGPNGRGPKKSFGKEEAAKARDYAISKGIGYEAARAELYPDSN